LDFIRKESNLSIITPLDVYQNISQKYKTFGLIAANCQSTANIERTLLKNNKDAVVIGVGNLKIVNDIESKKHPVQIIQEHSIKEICSALEKSGSEIIMLGCTHFPYFFEELKQTSNSNLFEPSEEMVKLL